MPCNTIQTMTLRLENADKAILRRAVNELAKTDSRWASSYVTADGRLSIYAMDRVRAEAQLKRAYSTEVVKEAAMMGQWELSAPMSNEEGQVTFQAQRIGMSGMGGM